MVRAPQKIATRDEVESYASEEMVKEYIDKRKPELEDLIKFNLAVDHIFDQEKLPLTDQEVQEEVDLRVKSYEVRAGGGAARARALALLATYELWQASAAAGWCGAHTARWCWRGGHYMHACWHARGSTCTRLQAQKVEYDADAVREQVITTIKSVKVVEWLKDNCKRTVLPWKGQPQPQPQQ